MTTDALAPIGEKQGAPTVFGVLSAEIYLEPIASDDLEPLSAANDLVWDWIGAELKQTWFSFYEGPVRTHRADLDYISGFARDLGKPKAPGASEEAHVFMADLARFPRSLYSVMCNGGAEPSYASPFSYRFWSETPSVGPDPDVYKPLAVLNVTVPESWPLDDFSARVRTLVEGLRVRWAVAGLSYSPWELTDPIPGRRSTYVHARRFTGYDVGYYVRFLEAWQEQIRSVNWMTFLGPDLRAKLAAETKSETLEPRGDVRVEQVGDTTLLVAGAAPGRGDRNRLLVPRAYQDADAMVRPLRAAGGIDFTRPWDEGTTTDWLRRFEYLVS